MKKLNKLALGLLLAGFMTASFANEVSVRAALTAKYPGTTVGAIEATPIPGIYQVTMGKNVAYTSEDGRYFLFGSLFDMQTQTDLTANKREQATRVDWNSLPLKDAIVTVKGNGARKLAVFTDPDCPYCKQLAKTLDTLDNVTIYNILFPIDSLHPDAAKKAESIYCAKDNVKALDDWFLRGVKPASKSCKSPVASNVEAAGRLGLNGTPMVISMDGRLMPGAAPKERIEAWLDVKQGKPVASAPMPGSAQ